MKKVCIIGAGISGLTLAYLLKKKLSKSHEICVFEKSNRAGGWIQTIYDNQFLFELGPRSFRSKGNGKYTLKLIEELGLKEDVVVENSASKKRFIYTNNKLYKIPSNIFSALFSPLMKGVPLALFKERNVLPSNLHDETIDSFATRRFGKHIAETFFDPMTSGIYAGNIKELSIKSCFPIIHEWEQNYGSVVKGLFSKKKTKESQSEFIENIQKSSLFSLKYGVESLVHALQKEIGSSLNLNQSIDKIEVKNNKPILFLENARQIECDHLYLCVPSKSVESLFKNISKDLPFITSTSVITISLGYRKNVLKREGFGHLIPSKENESILGVVWDSSAFPNQNHSPQETRLTVMMGGAHHPEALGMSNQQIERDVLNAMKKQLNIYDVPDSLIITRAIDAIPQYTLGHSERVKSLKDLITSFSTNITLLGNCYSGISVNDCIAEAYNLQL